MNEFRIKLKKTLSHRAGMLRCAIRDVRWNLVKLHADRPVFVVGCSRAGTTLVYKTLSASPELGSLQRETHDFWVNLHTLQERNWDTHALRAVDARTTDKDAVERLFYTSTGRRRWVDKNNQNGLCIPYLHALFPDANFVFIKRNPGDNLNSLIEGWGKGEKFSTWSGDLPMEVAIENGDYRRWCFFLADGWREYVNAPIEEVVAFQYESINQAILTAKKSVPITQWIDVFYEDILRDPAEGFRQVFQSCDLGYGKDLKAYCRGVLQIPYDVFGEINLNKWKEGRNREKVERALPWVQRIASELGYH